MSRGRARGHAWTRQCAHEGCSATDIHHYDTRRELSDAYRKAGDYLCFRHEVDADTLAPTRQLIVVVQTATPGVSGLTWLPASNGIIHGPGFHAWANEFPPGTQIRITAEVILPTEDPTP